MVITLTNKFENMKTEDIAIRKLGKKIFVGMSMSNYRLLRVFLM